MEERAQKLLETALAGRPDALASVCDFRSLCHFVDDLIDIPERRVDNAFIGLVLNKYVEFFSSDFYVQYRLRLYPIVKLIHHTYFTSLAWETATEKWKKDYSDVIRCCLNEYTFTVVELIVSEKAGTDAGYKFRREFELIAREESWFHHHNDKGEPI